MLELLVWCWKLWPQRVAISIRQGLWRRADDSDTGAEKLLGQLRSHAVDKTEQQYEIAKVGKACLEALL